MEVHRKSKPLTSFYTEKFVLMQIPICDPNDSHTNRCT